MRWFGIQKGEETERVSSKHSSAGSWPSDATIQSGVANRMVRETRETPFKTVLGQDQVPHSSGVQTPPMWEDGQTEPNQVLTAHRQSCLGKSSAPSTVSAGLVVRSLQDRSSHWALWKGKTAVCRDVIALNHLLDGVFEEGGRCVARRRDVKGAPLLLWFTRIAGLMWALHLARWSL